MNGKFFACDAHTEGATKRSFRDFSLEDRKRIEQVFLSERVTYESIRAELVEKRPVHTEVELQRHRDFARIH